eukprot:c2936_g1_i1.p1 GENE.c2936_g1_i1~~c2936_g1_i1.p1  ORF type:complete len:221 (+),score=59.23 c2936_g1_i1:1-663(+)
MGVTWETQHNEGGKKGMFARPCMLLVAVSLVLILGTNTRCINASLTLTPSSDDDADTVILGFEDAKQNQDVFAAPLPPPPEVADKLNQIVIAKQADQDEAARLQAIEKINNSTGSAPDTDMLAKMFANTEEELPPPNCAALSGCFDCLSNRKCQYCAVSKTCAVIPSKKNATAASTAPACEHPWSVFWPAGPSATQLLNDLCSLILVDYTNNPPKKAFQE